MAFREFYCSTQMQNYLEKRLLRILLHILSSSLQLPRRGRQAHDHRGRQSAVVILSFAFFPSGSGGKRKANPYQNLGNFSLFP